MVCMALHWNTFAPLTDHFANSFVHENVARIFDIVIRYDVRKFDADAILYADTRCKKMDISIFLVVFSVQFWLEWGKIFKNTSNFLIFTIVLQIFPVFFLQGRINSCGGHDRKIWAPYQPFHEFWIAGLDSSIWLGRYGWAKSLLSRAILVYDKEADIVCLWTSKSVWLTLFPPFTTFISCSLIGLCS